MIGLLLLRNLDIRNSIIFEVAASVRAAPDNLVFNAEGSATISSDSLKEAIGSARLCYLWRARVSCFCFG